MSEFNPFSSAAEEAPAAPEVAEEASGSRKTVVLLGALAAVAVGAGAFLFLGGGSDEAEEFTPLARAPRAVASVAPSPVAKLPVTTKVALGRNPFRALYVQPAAAPAAPADAGAGTGGGVVTSFGFAGPGAGAGASGPGPAAGDGGRSTGSTGATGGTGGTTTPTAKEHKLVLMRVFGTGKDQSGVFSIDGKQQTAKVGSTFGPTAEILLLSIQQGPKDDQWTAVLQVGDSDPFDAILGEPVFVR